MKLFVLLSRVPYPLEKGDKLRAYEQLKQLSTQFDIHLCCLHNSSSVDAAIEKALNEVCSTFSIIKLSFLARLWQLFVGFIKNRPIQVSYFYQTKAQRRINSLVKAFEPNHIYCQLIRTSEYVKQIQIPKTLDYMDALSKGFNRRKQVASFFTKPIITYEYNQLVEYEQRIFNVFDNHTIIADTDKSWIKHANNHTITIVPNGVDNQNFVDYKDTKKTYSIVFAGNMQYAPNVDAAVFLAEDILPIVQKDIPEANLLIAGATPTNKVKALQNNKVNVSGWVEDILECYAQANVFVAPMRLGSGLQNKLLEAMSMKVPCVTTDVANIPLGGENNKNILVGNTAQEIAKHIVNLLNNKTFSENIAEQGHVFVSENYDWQASTNKLAALFKP